MKFNILLLLLVFSSSLYAIRPLSEYVGKPEDYGLKCESKIIITLDSVNIYSNHIFPKEENKNKISIIISYGDMGNTSYWLNHAYYLSNMNFDVWLYDYRGFGKSDNFDIDSEQLYYKEFTKDLASVVKLVKDEKPDHKITLLSFSMGTIISMLYMNENNPHYIDYYIGDGHVYSPDLVKERIEKEVSKPELDFSFVDIYDSVTIPFLIFYGKNDPIIKKEDIL